MKREWFLGHLIGGQARRKANESWCKTPGIIGSPNGHQQHFQHEVRSSGITQQPKLHNS